VLPTTTDIPSTPELQNTFYRGINLNGPALIIDGYQWESASAANYSISGMRFCASWVTLVPATDAPRAQMVRCSVQNWAHNLVLNSVPAGTYEIYLYVWLDWANSRPDVFNILLEGQLVQSTIRLSTKGEWRRLGPYQVTITDNTINITSSGGVGNLSGVAVYRVIGS
jgi:hypothetical protein